MTDERDDLDFERRLRRTLHAAAPPADPHLPERLLARTIAEPQRSRRSYFSGFGPALAVAVVVVIAVVAGLALRELPRNIGAGPTTSPAPSVQPVGSPPASVSPTPTASPSAPTPTPSPDGKRCTNETDGFEVSFPADWFTNEEVEQEFGEPVPACRYFGAEPMEILPNAGLPPTVAIIFTVETEPAPDPEPAQRISTEEITVAGRPATASEWEFTDDSPFTRAGGRTTIYRIQLDDGSTLVAMTNPMADGDDEEHRAVLQRMVESLTLR